ncbi:hypothetical protein EJ02DRAFT_457910 [Clathrospora elynae]|uniref:ADP-ribose 1''-phosphate phosphatase n=1 Tax=Clathrospora elynae TaxID=706981 RepID=A0A6A5SCR5_9PLEO|nr:hypothetical protein EJ02DRAFT_457910 [Clathrospora elynae]
MSQRNSIITSYFQPKNKAKESTTNNSDSPESSKQEKGKGKRSISASPVPVPEKRRDVNGLNRDAPRHLSSKDLPSNWLATSSDDSLTTLSLTYHTGDIFAAPPNTLLIHACNTQGSWGAGIAAAFKSKYPKAYPVYRNFCINEYNPKSDPIPTGTALLIPPVDIGNTHWIGCLFTSAKYGKGKDKADVIVRNTAPAMQMLIELVNKAEGEIAEVRICKINSGKFGVPWEKTKDALEAITVAEGWKGSVQVWDPSDD